jgi:transposase
MRPAGSARELELRRKRAMKLVNGGHTTGDVARMVGCDQRSVQRWRVVYDRRGTNGLRARANTGRPPKLDDKQKEELQNILHTMDPMDFDWLWKTSRDFRFRSVLRAAHWTPCWTYNLVARLIRKEFHVRYSLGRLRRLLAGLGWNAKTFRQQAENRNSANHPSYLADIIREVYGIDGYSVYRMLSARFSDQERARLLTEMEREAESTGLPLPRGFAACKAARHR